MHWQTSRFRIDLSIPRVMGILNVTPDSFSDGGRHASLRGALDRGEALLRDGADILDIGGESTRPGSPAVPLEEELARVVPVVKEAVAWGVPISVDTYKPAVMQAVLDLGADIVNDIWALRQTGAEEAVVRHGTCGLCLMHMHGEPRTMQLTPMEGDVVAPVQDFLRSRADALRGQGVARERIALDPGIGFGKTVEQNFALLAHQAQLAADGHAWLAGWSRKSSLGAVTGLPVQDRLVPSVAAALLSVERGARIVRVHDVAETSAALRIWCAARLPSEDSGASRAPGPARPQP
ncbi:dihydropteroate synthase [Paracidovorax cattleyae]|uniref:Dihydropteroate synthase n=1 Tax=Paracidovorax cattleyae TaxID=80868 RepID=A0A1H0ST91_9BURK|nr:dihydropteroate synthase [Paracidovorax cattleyae]AVS74570.1 dihydropteroate synthase [Paracidovorax cattleyae]SDP45007.1 dihydropteroate synthase [Paracidovorax cattleyae]